MSTAYDCNVVLDLEFTHVPKRMGGNSLPHEIIEVGAVKLGPDGEVSGEFSHVVRPSAGVGVSGKVRRMTGIANEDIACARPLAEVLDALAAWIGPGRVRMVTWSDSDRKQIRSECAAKGIECDLPGRWLDIQRVYPRLMGIRKRQVALGEAADWCGIANDKGFAHRALYDARMTAEIFRMMAAGECGSHHEVVTAELSREHESCAASIADRCGGLAELFAKLQAQEVA